MGWVEYGISRDMFVIISLHMPIIYIYGGGNGTPPLNGSSIATLDTMRSKFSPTHECKEMYRAGG